MKIRKIVTVETRMFRIIVMCGIVIFLFSVICLLAAIMAEQELRYLQKRSSYPIRVEKEIFDVGTYRCQKQLDYVIFPRKGQTYVFACSDGNKYKDTITLTTTVDKPAVDYALD